MSDTAMMIPELAIGNILSGSRTRYRLGYVTDCVEDNSILIASLESQYLAAKHEVKLYGQLIQGWDGYDGEAFKPDTIAEALSALEISYRFLRNRQVELKAIIPGPASDGSIDLEFRTDQKKLRLTFDPRMNHVSVFKKDAITSTENPVPIDAPHLENELGWLSS